MKWTKEEWLHVTDRLAEALREVGLLWITFALLDRLVSGTLTFPWVIENAAVAIAMWIFGLHIEIGVRRSR